MTADNFVSFDGVLYGLPASVALQGRVVQVGPARRCRADLEGGQVVAEHQARPLSGTQVLHPEQFTGVPPARTAQQTPAPLATNRRHPRWCGAA
ncbi:MAG: hypothetical protein IPO81_25505 [Kouleothrix sp.]|nr:hypothetical protein [Kouleothrix sp.]